MEERSFVERLDKYQVNDILAFLFNGRFTEVVNTKKSARKDVKNLEDFIFDVGGRVVWGKYYTDNKALRVYVLDQYDNFKVNTVILYDDKIFLPHFEEIAERQDYQDKYRECLLSIFGNEYKNYLKYEMGM